MPPPPLTIPTLPGPGAMSPEEWARLPHDSMAGLPISVAAVCISLSSLVVSLRLYTRSYVIAGEVGKDDIFAIVALLFVYANCGLAIAHTSFGLGAHGYDLQGGLETIVDFFKLLYAQQLVYHTNLLFIKLTLLLQYYRLVYLIDAYRTPYMVIMAISVLWALISVCLLAFSCYPIAAFWDKTIPNFTCNFATGLVATVGNIITDFVILLLPIPVVLQLNMGTPQKVATLCIFAVGSFACIVSILRLVLLPSALDVTYTAAVTASWTLAELTAGLICPCLMTLGPLLRRVAPMLASLSKRGGRSSDRTAATSGSHPSKFGRREGYKLQSIGRRSANTSRPTPGQTNFEGSEEELTLHDMFGTSRATTHQHSQSESAARTLTEPGNREPSPRNSGALASPYGPPLEHSRSQSFHMDRLCLTPGVRTEISAGPSWDNGVAAVGARDGTGDGPGPDPRRSPSPGIQIDREWLIQENNGKGRAGRR
ncbi:hypothetical protein PG993_004215 [Apiospora rasikravindrae]|uniref:Rhodopsin domain-containing protein n=1 Tax=Apiospora rasikravindrae TaxID=990691 RepID=A0ABR1TC44_9PEZI